MVLLKWDYLFIIIIQKSILLIFAVRFESLLNGPTELLVIVTA